MKKLLFIVFLLFATPSWSATYYVRSDGGPGGTTSTKCNGLTDAAFTGSNGPNCAFNHPNWAIPMAGQPTTYRISGGDTLIIKDGEYRIGCPGTSNCLDASINITGGTCNNAWTYDCKGNPIPDGSQGSPTTIIGCSVNGCGEGTKPILWGSGRSQHVLSLNGSDYVTISDIEITDHSNCVRGGYQPNQCISGINELGADKGIYANSGSNIILNNLYIHGMGIAGLFMGGIQNLTLSNVVLDKNGYIGFDGDSCGGTNNCGFTGNIILDHVQITYSGCAEDYPGGGIPSLGCTSQSGGGYGDGIGTGNTGGDWVITDSIFSHNVQDGIDLLYLSRGVYDGTLTIKRTLVEGNAGNQVKVADTTTIEDSVIIGNCDYFDGKDYEGNGFDHCRAGGDTIAMTSHAGGQFKLTNNTITGIGSSLLLFADNWNVCEPTCGYGCDGTETYTFRNNIYYGTPGNCMYTINMLSGVCNVAMSEDNSIFYNIKNNECVSPVSNNLCNTNPNFTAAISNDNASNLDSVYITAANNAADETVSGADDIDYNGFPREASWDSGALEYGSTPTEISDCITSADSCLTEVDCEGAGWYWWSIDVCHADIEPDPPLSCANDCTLCTAVNCLSTGPSCFLQLDNTCKSTIDPCNASCGDCSSANCSSSTIDGGCFLWANNICKNIEETCSNSCGICSTENLCSSSPNICNWEIDTCTKIDECHTNYSLCLTADECTSAFWYWWTDGVCRADIQGVNVYRGHWKLP